MAALGNPAAQDWAAELGRYLAFNELDSVEQTVDGLRAAGIHQTGFATYGPSQVSAVAGRVVTVTRCVDPSAVGGAYIDGSVAVAAKDTPSLIETDTIRPFEDGAWRVTDSVVSDTEC